MKAVVFLPNWLGDLTMSTPLLRAVRCKFGKDARLIGVMRPHLADVLSGTDWLDEQWYFAPRGADRAQRVWAVADRMRRERFDLAILLTNSFRAGLMAWWAGAKQRLGYVRNGRGFLLTHKLYPRKQGRRIVPEPTVESYLAIADALGCGRESPRLELAVTAEQERSADAVFKRLGLRRDGRVILLNCSGAYGAAKLWPTDNFGLLANLLAARCDCDALVMCGPGERGIAKEIVAHANNPRVFSMADQPLDLGTAKACIKRGRLMVSTDSGPRHVAAALGKPVITLYGPMSPIYGRNPTQQAIDLMLDLDCIGCRKRVCPLGHHRCMRDLGVDMVFGAVLKMLEHCRPVPQPHFDVRANDAALPGGRPSPHFPAITENTNLFDMGQGSMM
jgi:heptosyltransferase II